MSEASQKSSKPASERERKVWKKPELRRLKLTEEEVDEVRHSDDPEALLRELLPAIKERDAG